MSFLMSSGERPSCQETGECRRNWATRPAVLSVWLEHVAGQRDSLDSNHKETVDKNKFTRVSHLQVQPKQLSTLAKRSHTNVCNIFDLQNPSVKRRPVANS